MKISKIVVLILSLVVAVSSLFGLVSCGEEEVIYTIKYSADEGKTAYKIFEVAEGKAVTVPEDPTKDGYDFAGWFYDVAAERPMEDDYVASEDITFYAKWVAHVHDLKHTDAKDATCKADGNVEYWYCALCDKYYDGDGLAAEQIAKEDIAITDGTHKYDAENKCEFCKKERNEIILSLNSDKKGYTYLGDGDTEASSVVIPSTYKDLPVTAIADGAFEGYANITEIVIPESVTSIGANAFSGCVSLKSIVIPEKITAIGNSAFYNCIALETIELNAKALADLKAGNLVFAADEQDEEGNAIVRANIAVTVGAAVENLPANIFAGCAAVSSVTFADGSACKAIGSYALAGTSIESIAVPATVETVGTCALKGTSALNAISVAEGNENYVAKGNCLFAKNSVEGKDENGEATVTVTYDLVAGSNASVIPADIDGNAITSIAEAAFYMCVSLESVDIPATVVSIGADAFVGCSALSAVNLPDGVETIGNFAFASCSSITSIVIPKTVKSIGNGAFGGCVSLTDIQFNAEACADFAEGNLIFAYTVGDDVTLPEKITLTIGEGVKVIPAYLASSTAASDTVNATLLITDIVINAAECEAFGAYAFANALSLKAITYNVVNCADFADRNCVFANAGMNGDGIKLTVGAAVESIPANIFSPDYNGAYSVKLSEVVFEGTACKKIGYNAFFSATSDGEAKVSISSVDAWVAIEFVSMYSNPLSVGAGLFVGDALVENLTVTADAIGAYTFAGYKALKSATVDAASIGTNAFYGCDALTEIKLGSKVKEIAAYAFVGCNALAKAELVNASGWELYNSYDKSVGTVNVTDFGAAALALIKDNCGYTWKCK